MTPTALIIPGRLLCPNWNQEPNIPVTVIQTLYNPFLEQNVAFPGPKKSHGEEKQFQFTEQQREFASRAKVPRNLNELKVLVRTAF